MRTLGLCLLVAAAAVAACGSNSSSGTSVDASTTPDAGPPDATPVVTIDDLCGPTGVYVMLVDKLVGCEPILDLVDFQGQGTPAAIGALCHGAYDPYMSTIDLPSYAQLQACLSYVSQTACLDLDFNATACNLFHGKVADASACDSTEQCTDASYCDRPNEASCGTCMPRQTDGSSCTADEQCMNGKCVGTQCGHPGMDGDPCVIDAQTNSSDDCLGTRVCNPSTHECETVNWQLNDTCATLSDCGILNTDLYCKPTNGTINTAGQCATYLPMGTACTAAKPGEGLCDIRSYEWCNPAATGGAKCSALNIVQDGQSCSMFDGNQCATGLVCSDPLGSGASAGKCYTPTQKDGACGGTSDAPCAAFLDCINGQCEYTDDTPKCPS